MKQGQNMRLGKKTESKIQEMGGQNTGQDTRNRGQSTRNQARRTKGKIQETRQEDIRIQKVSHLHMRTNSKLHYFIHEK